MSHFFALISEIAERIIGKLADGVVALSGQVYRFYSGLNKNMFFVPVFVDTNIYVQGQSEMHGRGDFREVGLIGPFEGIFNEYQLEFLLREIDRIDSRIRFTLIGKTINPISNQRIQLLGYLASEQEYVLALRRLDALLMPVRIPTFGPKNKVLEAMACGVPVFTTPQGIIGLDYALPSHNIFVFPESEIVGRMNSLLFQTRAKQVAENGREMVLRHYSLDTCRANLLRVLESLLDSD